MRSRLQWLSVVWSLTLTLLIGPYLSSVFAESDRSYKAVREWLEKVSRCQTRLQTRRASHH